VTTKISLKKASLLLGSNILLDKGDCQALISNKEIIIENLSGETRGLPVSLSGNFSYLEPRQLYLKGNLGESDDTLFVKLLTDNKCALDWESKKKESHLKLHADISDLNNLVFKITAQGDMRFCDMNRLIAGAETVKGSMKVKAEVKGEADKWESLDGKAVIEVNDFSFLETKAVSFEFDLDVKKGLFIGKIPRTRFCGGTFDGEVKATMHKLGVELDIDRIDIGEFMQPASRFKGTKGIISGNIVFITHWTDPTDAVGGGYINAADCDFRSLPLFLSAREGMGSATKNADFKMPVFKKIEGNYQIKDRGLDLEGISCDAAGLNLIISGGCKFAGDVDFTIDARFLGTGMFRTARQVILPETIALDLVADSIVVEVRGRWSELKQDTTIKPIRSIFTLLPTEGSASPGKYTLEKF
jgi:hypothetical protein